MMITGVAGFVGSATARLALAEGIEVVGIDCFTPYYEPSVKQRNIADIGEHPRFSFIEADLRSERLTTWLRDCDVVLHLAAEPGVRDSWSRFDRYVDLNISATKTLLDAARAEGIGRVVYASSSSVYGNPESFPTLESDPTVPFSPYGITKLAAEQLCRAYSANFDLETVSLRYFTVYGPGQRPDMATFRLIQAALGIGDPFPMYGAGTQRRDFTFVEDVARANLAASTAAVTPGSVFNIAGGDSCTVQELVSLVERSVGAPVPIIRLPGVAGDVDRTGGAIERAHEELNWTPRVLLAEGLDAQVDWQRRRSGISKSV